MTEQCNCLDCAHGNGGMRTMWDMQRDPENGNGVVVDALMPAMALMHKCEYRAKTIFDDGYRVRMFKTQGAALEWAKERLAAGNDVEIKRVFAG